ncbi:testis-expressed protein 47-like isoform X2 [Pelodiscus sinensis]|uniref:testis-expressed protein 47-like isoform X2 n=1 Tax=Pelodiscus sinensis TaxID=13735 RepID=UPI003F6C09E1
MGGRQLGAVAGRRASAPLRCVGHRERLRPGQLPPPGCISGLGSRLKAGWMFQLSPRGRAHLPLDHAGPASGPGEPRLHGRAGSSFTPGRCRCQRGECAGQPRGAHGDACTHGSPGTPVLAARGCHALGAHVHSEPDSALGHHDTGEGPAAWRRGSCRSLGLAALLVLPGKRRVGGFSAGHWQRLLLSLQRCYPGEGVTGLVLLYPTYVVHALEASSEVLYAVLRDLRDMQPQQHRALVLEPKILVLSHDIPARLFQQWSYKVLAVPSRHLGYDASRQEPVEAVAGECLALLLKLGVHLQKYPKGPPNLPDAALEKVPNLIIPQDTICHLLECRELLSPAQFLQAYDSPLNVVLDSERVWPLPAQVRLDSGSP